MSNKEDQSNNTNPKTKHIKLGSEIPKRPSQPQNSKPKTKK